MRVVTPMTVNSLEQSFELEAEELYHWPRIEYRVDLSAAEPELVLTAVRFHGVDVLARLDAEQRCFYLQQCRNHRLQA
jgi:hypothetical protein